MTDMKPSFVTGAKAIVKIRSTAIAFCSDVTYNVNVQHVPIESLGIFEIISHEPVAYSVEGSFSVVRYASDNGQLEVFRTSLNAGAGTQQTANHAAGLQINDHINPGAILTSTTFDMEVVEKSSGTEKNVN
jgi:hypothetical protein